MRKALAILATVAVFALVLAGCGSGSTTTATGTTTTTGTTTPGGVLTTSPTGGGSGGVFTDVPIYPGSEGVQQGSWSIPGAAGDYSTVEWHYFQTNASTDDVKNYYDGVMPDNGWTENANLNTPGFVWLSYDKNSENDAAIVWISTDSGETIIALMRASK